MDRVAAVFDIGKTNKKLLLFNEALEVIDQWQETIHEQENTEYGLIDDVASMESWIENQLRRLAGEPSLQIGAINFTTFGATVAHLDDTHTLALPVLSYANAFGDEIHSEYCVWMESVPGGFARYATPPLPAFLNVGKQLFWLVRKRPDLASRIHKTVFLPQYFVFRLTGRLLSEPTCYGCHTGLWDFNAMEPGRDVLSALGWTDRMPPLVENAQQHLTLDPAIAARLGLPGDVVVGTGLHDSSSALLPYLTTLSEPFALVSTGTWIITLNPFAQFHLTDDDLQRDRLYYLTPERRPVRAARLFAGREHDVQLERIEKHFGRRPDVSAVEFRSLLPGFLNEPRFRGLVPEAIPGTGPFPNVPKGTWDVAAFATAEEAYARLILDLAVLTDFCISEVSDADTCCVVLDGGFARNAWFTQAIAMLEQPLDVYVAEVPEATALGSAMAVHRHFTQAPAERLGALKLEKVEAEPLTGLKLYAEHLVARWEKMELDSPGRQGKAS